MHKIESAAKRRFLDNLLGSTLNKCSRWAPHRIWMPSHNGKPAGWFSFEDFPWVREILDSRATNNWVMKSSQTGLTTSGIVRGFHETDYFGKDTMYLMPTDKVAQLFSKTRVSGMIEDSPYLRERVSDTLEVKQIGRHCFYIRGANGDINVKSTPVHRLLIDEVDEMKERQIWLALERLSGQSDKMVWGMGTPTIPNFGIHKLYMKSTQEHFFFECYHCRKLIELKWPESFVVCGDSVDDPDVFKSHCICTECKGPLDHDRKRIFLKDGLWMPTSIEADKDTRGFHLPQMYSSTVSPGEFAISYLRGIGDEDARREFHNSKLGQPYIEDGAQLSDVQIDDCVKKYSTAESFPRFGGKDLITLGIDQGAFHHFVAVKWDLANKSFGDINDKAYGKVIGFGRIIQEDWPAIHDLMRKYQVLSCVVDYFPDPVSARRFARRFPGYVWACQYVVGRTARELKKEEDEFGSNIVKADKTSWLSKTFSRVSTKQIDFPLDISLQFRQQLKAQVRTHTRGPDGNYQPSYVKLSDDHYGHALNYAEIALATLDPTSFGSDIIS